MFLTRRTNRPARWPRAIIDLRSPGESADFPGSLDLSRFAKSPDWLESAPGIRTSDFGSDPGDRCRLPSASRTRRSRPPPVPTFRPGLEPRLQLPVPLGGLTI